MFIMICLILVKRKNKALENESSLGSILKTEKENVYNFYHLCYVYVFLFANIIVVKLKFEILVSHFSIKYLFFINLIISFAFLLLFCYYKRA